MDEATSTIYDYVVIGAGVCGCTIAHKLFTKTKNILLIDKNSDVAMGASGAAGAFLSPLLGKPNHFKDLVNKALVFSTNYYKEKTPQYINNCGTVRIPKNDIDREKFESYKPYIEFPYEEKEGGFYFPIASVVEGYNICKQLTQNIQKKFNYEINCLDYKEELWILNTQIKTKNIIFTTGAYKNLLNEKYLNTRPVWGQRIDVETDTQIDVNYHKDCSLSYTKQRGDKFVTSIGATHHRFVLEKDTNEQDTHELLLNASKIKELSNTNVIARYGGARASSVDYFPLLGEIVDSKQTLDEFPYLKHGTHVQAKRFTKYKNLYICNGVGGRGFVLAPFLAHVLFEFLIYEKNINKLLKVDRLFIKWVKSKKT